jgi:hypothetical protein
MLRGANKGWLLEDIQAFYKVEIQKTIKSYFVAFYKLMVKYPAFRNVFYHRFGYCAFLVRWALRERNTLEINTKKIGGVFISSMGLQQY